MADEDRQPEGSLDQAFEQANSDLDAQAKALKDTQTKAEEHWNLYLRAKADLENIRKRAQTDVSNAHKYANEKFASEMLSVVDSLEHGLSIAESAGDSAYREGMMLTLKLCLDIFEKFGILRIDPVGEQFDPTRHEAISTQVTQDQPPNKVITVVQKGFILNDRVLRPARVIVSKSE